MDYGRSVAAQPETPTWRQGFDAVERQLSPVLEELVQSESFAVAVGLAARVQRAMQDQASRSTRRVLHALNLPAGTDVARILNELGQLQRQVRDLSAQLDEAQAELQQARASTPRKRAAGGR
jgi:polyhydroxyalkanoate synthesis regulator phasin